MPSRVALDAAAGVALQLDQPQDLLDAGAGEPGAASDHPQVVAAAAAGMKAGAVEDAPTVRTGSSSAA